MCHSRGARWGSRVHPGWCHARPFAGSQQRWRPAAVAAAARRRAARHGRASPVAIARAGVTVAVARRHASIARASRRRRARRARRERDDGREALAGSERARARRAAGRARRRRRRPPSPRDPRRVARAGGGRRPRVAVPAAQRDAPRRPASRRTRARPRAPPRAARAARGRDAREVRPRGRAGLGTRRRARATRRRRRARRAPSTPRACVPHARRRRAAAAAARSAPPRPRARAATDGANRRDSLKGTPACTRWRRAVGEIVELVLRERREPQRAGGGPARRLRGATRAARGRDAEKLTSRPARSSRSR